MTYLDRLQMFTIKLGLDNETRLLAEMSEPHRQFPAIHIAGTNGKGSVGATLMTVLAAHGYKVGLYSSPHLQDIRERFRINDEWISKQAFSNLIQHISDTLGKQSITYFECTTTLAFLWFAQEKVDIAVIETGLGGRLDATNVLQPLISVLTNVSLDHQEHLGNTTAAIASEKAGIIKPFVPVICGELPAEAEHIIHAVCREKQCRLLSYGQDFTASSTKDRCIRYHGFSENFQLDFYPALAGKHQWINTAVALAVLELLQDYGFPLLERTLCQALSRVRWPGRLEFFQLEDTNNTRISLLLDGAHNQAGVTALKEELQSRQFNKLILIWGSMRDKKIGTSWDNLLQEASTILYTRAETERSADPISLKEQTPLSLRHQVHCHSDPAEALQHALTIQQPGDLICVAGSLYLVGKIRTLVQDCFSIREGA